MPFRNYFHFLTPAQQAGSLILGSTQVGECALRFPTEVLLGMED